MSDLFLSYSSKDRGWGAKLEQALRRRLPNLSIFFDQNSLRAGDVWEPAIETALRNSKHLLVLWSDAAKDSSWVSRELWTYKAVAMPETNTDRRLICVYLEGSNPALNMFQQLDYLWLRAAYGNPGEMREQDWSKLIEAIVDALDPKRQRLLVPLVVLAATKTQLAALPDERWREIEQELGITRASLVESYGNTPLDWQPFAEPQSVLRTFEDVLSQLNRAMKQYKLSWHLPDPGFWAGLPAAKKFVEEEFSTARLSVLVVDPVAIYLHDVYQRLMLFLDAMASRATVIITLAPFGPPPSIVRLRNALINRGMPYFDDYFQRTVPPRRKLVAQCGWNVSDWEDVRRHILAAAENLGDEPGNQSPAYLRHR